MSHIASNRFESLSNELLLDIFEYVDVYNAGKAFYGLNHRLNALLRSAHLHMHVDLSNQDKTVWNTRIPFISSSQIYGLSYKYGTMVEQLLHFGKENLRFLSLCVMNRTLTDKILQLIPTNNQIKCFYIREGRSCNNSNHRSLIDFILIDHGHRFTSLVNLSLSSAQLQTFPSNVSVIFPQLRRLSMNNWFWTSMFSRFLQDSTPKLRSLHFNGICNSPNQLSEFALPQIHEFQINNSDHFIDLHNILFMFPSLRRLHIDLQNNSGFTNANGTHWQEVIEKYIPHLKQLTIDSNNRIEEGILNTFRSGKFWSKKNVTVKIIIDKIQFEYRLIHTIYFGKRFSFNYFHDFKF